MALFNRGPERRRQQQEAQRQRGIQQARRQLLDQWDEFEDRIDGISRLAWERGFQLRPNPSRDYGTGYGGGIEVTWALDGGWGWDSNQDAGLYNLDALGETLKRYPIIPEAMRPPYPGVEFVGERPLG